MQAMLILSVLLTALAFVDGENLPQCDNLLEIYSSTPRIWYPLINLADLQYYENWTIELKFSKPVILFQLVSYILRYNVRRV